MLRREMRYLSFHLAKGVAKQKQEKLLRAGATYLPAYGRISGGNQTNEYTIASGPNLLGRVGARRRRRASRRLRTARGGAHHRPHHHDDNVAGFRRSGVGVGWPTYATRQGGIRGGGV